MSWRSAFLKKLKTKGYEGRCDYGLGERLRGDGRRRRHARTIRCRFRKARRKRPPDARSVVRVCQDGQGARYRRDHRRCGRRGASARHGGFDDDAARGGRSGQVARPERAGLAVVDRADARGRSRGHHGDQRFEECGADRRLDSRFAGCGTRGPARSVPRQTDRRRT